MTKRGLLIFLGVLFFFFGMGMNASDDEHRSDTGAAVIFWIVSAGLFIGAWKTKDQ